VTNSAPAGPDELGEAAAPWLARRPQAVAGRAEVFYLADDAPTPVRACSVSFACRELDPAR
jgi:hypothetical protein